MDVQLLQRFEVQPIGKLFLVNTKSLFARSTFATVGAQLFGKLFLASTKRFLDVQLSQLWACNRSENCSWPIQSAFLHVQLSQLLGFNCLENCSWPVQKVLSDVQLSQLWGCNRLENCSGQDLAFWTWVQLVRKLFPANLQRWGSNRLEVFPANKMSFLDAQLSHLLVFNRSENCSREIDRAFSKSNSQVLEMNRSEECSWSIT